MNERVSTAYQQLQLPDIDFENDCVPGPATEDEECRLTDLVRKQYLHFIENLLHKNYEEWTKKGPEDLIQFTAKEIRACAEKLELTAVKNSILVRLYRAETLKIISDIRQETKNTEIHTKLIQQKFSHVNTKYRDVAMQTEPESRELAKKRTHRRNSSIDTSVSTTTALDLKIQSFAQHVLHQSPKIEKRHRRRETKRSRSPRLFDILSPPPSKYQSLPVAITSSTVQQTPSPILTPDPIPIVLPPPPKNQNEDDKIMEELQLLFGDDNKEDCLREIFEDCGNPQIDQIMQEINQFDVGMSMSTQPRSESPKMEIAPQENSLALLSKAEQDTRHQQEIEHKLKNSIWPCELHMQTMKLREILSRVAEEDLYKFEIIKVRFVQFFDDDDTEELLAPYSPTIELNEVLLASCRTRISRWVVNSLMRPLNQGLIANRFLFKKLAKRVADNIIFTDQYPSERYIRKYVEDYFCTHPVINAEDDIT